MLALLAEQLQRSDATKVAPIGLISERDLVSTGDRSLRGVALLAKAYQRLMACFQGRGLEI